MLARPYAPALSPRHQLVVPVDVSALCMGGRYVAGCDR